MTLVQINRSDWIRALRDAGRAIPSLPKTELTGRKVDHRTQAVRDALLAAMARNPGGKVFLCDVVSDGYQRKQLVKWCKRHPAWEVGADWPLGTPQTGRKSLYVRVRGGAQ